MSHTPGHEPEERLPAPEERLPATRPESEVAPVERFSSLPSTRSVELTPERAAQVVRSSSNARWVGFLAVIVVVLFVAIYWFYELGAAWLDQSRLEAETDAQQVTRSSAATTCSRPTAHAATVPTARAGSARRSTARTSSSPPVGRLPEQRPERRRPLRLWQPELADAFWSNEGHPPGPLNYVQLDDVIAFIRAPSTNTYTMRDPELLEPEVDPLTGQVKTFKGWVDPNYKPAPGATPFPACWHDEFTNAGAVRVARSPRRPGRGPVVIDRRRAP